MKYTDYPIRLVSEIGRDGFESRKIEFWSDGRVGYASAIGASQDTALGDKPVPAIEEINAQAEFRAKEIDASAFQELWDRHVDGRARRIECSITFDGKLAFVELQPSYGCKMLALCESVKVEAQD